MAKSSNVAVKIHTVFMIAAAVRDMPPAHLRAATLAEYHILSGVSRGFDIKVRLLQPLDHFYSRRYNKANRL